MIKVSQGLIIPGLTIVKKIEDPIRLCTIYFDDIGGMVVGFSGTKNSLLDWILNLNPEIEALTLIGEIKHWIYVYRPAIVKLVGHSSGGAHALKIAEWLPDQKREVITFGGLPTDNDPGCKVTNYLRRDDPMAWVPWWIFGLRFVGKIVKLGPKSRPKLSGHLPENYEKELS